MCDKRLWQDGEPPTCPICRAPYTYHYDEEASRELMAVVETIYLATDDEETILPGLEALLLKLKTKHDERCKDSGAAPRQQEEARFSATEIREAFQTAIEHLNSVRGPPIGVLRSYTAILSSQQLTARMERLLAESRMAIALARW